jgi:hypothetical protein
MMKTGKSSDRESMLAFVGSRATALVRETSNPGLSWSLQTLHLHRRSNECLEELSALFENPPKDVAAFRDAINAILAKANPFIVRS